MCNDEITDYGRQVIFLSQSHSVCHMVYNHLGAFERCQTIMIFRADAFIFHEALRIFRLADIVIHGTRTHEKHIRIDTARCRIGQVHHLERMLESSRGFLCQYSEQLIVRIRQVLETCVGNQAEYLLHQENERIPCHRQH